MLLDPLEEVQEGRFRRDLFHRLSAYPLEVPPLRKRREDIPLLTSYLVTAKARQLGRTIERIPVDVMDRLTAYDWPGNVRELENVLERSIILSPDKLIQSDTIHLPSMAKPAKHGREVSRQVAAGAADAADAADAAGDETLRSNERAHILRVCEGCNWKIKGPGGAAQKLGLNLGTLYSRMKKLGIVRP